MRVRRLMVGVGLLLLAAEARAERMQVYSVQGADCASCLDDVRKELKTIKGIGKVEVDRLKVEVTVRMDDAVTDEVVLAAIGRTEKGLKGVVGAGHGSYLAFNPYPAGADVQTLTTDGAAQGALQKKRVDGKYTVFDLYADWCGPCRLVDEKLRAIAGSRSDVAVRRLNVVDFESPLAREMGPSFDTLPYVVVFTPRGKKVEIVGADFAKLEKALGTP